MDYECIAGKYNRCIYRRPSVKPKYCSKCGEFVCRCRDSQCRYQPAQIEASARPNKSQYLKLWNGDIYDTKSNTILTREALESLLDG